jgi:catechol 2,3-dioxygenase-like lactoylglutathione lyase family enzyme
MKTEKTNVLKPHISLNVNNIDDSVNFYRKMLGIEPLKFIKGETPDGQRKKSGYAKFDVENPPLNLALNEVRYEKGGSLSHLGLQVAATEDVLAIRERWVNEGLLTVDEMKVDCCYALQDKTWARDPDGNNWEVFAVLENTESKGSCACDDSQAKAETAETESACCMRTALPINISSKSETAKCC